LTRAVIAALALAVASAWSARAHAQDGGEAPATEWRELSTAPASQPDGYDERAARDLYDGKCRICHGAGGRGEGPAARFLDPAPRDFTRGAYKFRSTPSGELPTDDDLVAGLRRGLHGTAMPSWDGLADADLRQLVALIKGFSERFETSPPTRTLVIGEPPLASRASVERGRAVYDAMRCAECHGPDGSGDGPARDTMTDDLGRPIYPFDLARGENFRGGSEPEDIYRTFLTGLNGTPMPAYEGVLSRDEAWDLVHFVRSLFVDAR
jgi:mono/diheme cytochrome c family protein